MQPRNSSVENSLRHLLNEWDPIGVADDVQDEYDCMLAPCSSGSVPVSTGRRSASSYGTS
ncbi:hypothetical protein [Streptomyces sp. NPDC060322]|uniref:hypothetical protein n=1 Tax=Streptomyces sp. NPDC060322 TaxID=3347097 RepID=UPI00364955E4